jgi:membrane protein DedA with SNARE-associated domain
VSITQQFTALATNLISSLGYSGLAAGLVIDSAGVPIPSEVLLPLAGALAHQGRFSLLLVIVVGTLAQTAGALLSYWLGATAGLEIVKRYGKYVLFRNRELEKTHELFGKYGSWLALAGRAIPGVRTYIGYPAGIARMRVDLFIGASLLGSLIWTAFLSILGYQLANQLNQIAADVNGFGLVMLLLGLAAFIVYLKRRNHTQSDV